MASIKAARKALAEQRRGAKFESFMLMLLISLRRAGVPVRHAGVFYFEGKELDVVATASEADSARLPIVSRTGVVLSVDSKSLTVYALGGKRLYSGTSFKAAVAAIDAGKKLRTVKR